MFTMILLLCLSLILTSTLAEESYRDYLSDSNVGRTLLHRLSLLKLISSSSHKKIQNNINPHKESIPPKVCDPKNIVQIVEYQFGRNGNQLIEFTHGIWVAYRHNRTFMMPEWMNTLLLPFEVSYLHTLFCFREYTKPTDDMNILPIESADSFFAFKLANQPIFASLFYIDSKTPTSADIPTKVIDELSLFYISVYTALWSHPKHSIVKASKWLIEHHLQGNFRYSSVHKRTLEGGCSEIFVRATKVSDFSPSELPMNHIEWTGRLHKSHPLCMMSESFVTSTMSLHNRSSEHTKLFVAFDGAGDIHDYKKNPNTVFLDVLNEYHEPKNTTGTNTHTSMIRRTNRVLRHHNPSPNTSGDTSLHMFIDMFVAMQSDLFILNPRSTFSWQIFVIRACLSLQSIPILLTQDLFMEAKGAERPLWVSWSSIQTALLDLYRR